MIGLTLASQSSARKKILRDAGIEFQAIASNVDEQAEKTRLLAAGATPADIAEALARAKALDIAAHTPGWVIGADQTLEFQGVTYDKVESLAAARERLAMLSGHMHLLQTATAVARDGQIVWRNLTTCRLTMRRFSDAYLDSYLDRNMPGILSSVGWLNEVFGLCRSIQAAWRTNEAGTATPILLEIIRVSLPKPISRSRLY